MTIEVILLIMMFVLLISHVIMSAMERKSIINSFAETLKYEQNSREKERSELLDRIQSESFTQYKSMEISKIKAEKKEEEKPQYELEEL